MKTKIALLLLLFAGNSLTAQTVTFSHVKIHRHRSPKGHSLTDREGVLTFDDVNRQITFHNAMHDRFDEDIKFEAAYDSVIKVVFDSTTHIRGEGKWTALNFISTTGIIVASAIGAKNVQDNWLYLEYKRGDHTERVLLMLPNGASSNVEQEAVSRFSARVVTSDFPEHSQDIPEGQLQSAEFKSKFAVKLDKKDHPFPTNKPDKATVVVVCPKVGLDPGQDQLKLHANDRVVAINELGSYSFAYLDPGKYRLISQSDDNDSGFETELEAGKTYYFLQNRLPHGRTVLSRNSGEVVTYLAADTYLSEWKAK
jgi:hypothetical protein